MPDKKKAPMSRVNMSLPADLKKAAQAYALQRGINLQDLVAEALLQVVPRKVTVRIIESPGSGPVKAAIKLIPPRGDK